MVRTQIQLTEQQARKLRERARQEGISLAEVIRRCVERELGDKKPDLTELYARAATVIGKFPDHEGATDVGENHDAYLDEAYR